jgi:hypothetical protein
MKWKRETKDFFVESSLFEKFGLRYLGPIDGHNIDELVKNLEFAKQSDGPILLHVLTKKGKGLEAAVKAPEKFHGLGPFDPVTGESKTPAARHAAQLPGRVRPGARALRPRPIPTSSASPPPCRAAPGSPASPPNAPSSFSTSASPRSTPCFSPPASPPRASGRCARSTRRSCSAPTIRSSTTSACRICR